MKRRFFFLIAIGTLVGAFFILRAGPGKLPEMKNADQLADAILVNKSERKLFLLKAGAVIR
jgi:hypothetical protein